MDVFTLFEQRTGEVLQSLPPNARPAIPFKKVARQVVRAMRKGAFVMDGRDAVPALYTVLVSPGDDAAMEAAYPRLAHEIELLVASQAEERGYALVGDPLARFLPDAGVRAGRFAVIADNVDARSLGMLREDEEMARRAKGPGRGTGGTGGDCRQLSVPRSRRESDGWQAGDPGAYRMAATSATAPAGWRGGPASGRGGTTRPLPM